MTCALPPRASRHHRLHRVGAAALAVTAGFATPAWSATGPWGTDWGGYGSLSAYRADLTGARLRPDTQFAGSATGGEWRADADSRLALQARKAGVADTDWVLQLSTSNTESQHYRPHVDWAYVDLPLSERSAVRLGRQTLPFLRHSETRYVGYAQAAVRPNPTVYGLSTGSPVDGANLTWEGEAQGGTVRADLGVGRSSARVGGGPVHVRHSVVAGLQWQRGDWTGRLAASDFQLDLSPQNLLPAAWQADCTNCATVLPARAPTSAIHGRIASAQLVWSGHPWEVTAEALWRSDSTSAFIPRARGAYVQVSRRWEAWQAQVAAGRMQYREPPLGLAARDGAPATVRAGLDALDRFLQSPNDLAQWQLGMRWDFGARTALKLQQEFWRALRDTTTGRRGLVRLDSPPLAATPSLWNGRAQLTTVQLDFLF